MRIARYRLYSRIGILRRSMPMRVSTISITRRGDAIRMPKRVLWPASVSGFAAEFCRGSGPTPRRNTAPRLRAARALQYLSGPRRLKRGNQVFLAVADQIGAAHALQRFAKHRPVLP